MIGMDTPSEAYAPSPEFLTAHIKKAFEDDQG